jgi:hypothetical protein
MSGTDVPIENCFKELENSHNKGPFEALCFEEP